MKYLKLFLFLVTGFAFDCHTQEVWTLRSPQITADDLTDIIWTGKQLVAVGAAGTIITSPDGIIWTNRFSGTGEGLYSLMWTGFQVIALGNKGSILTSPNGMNWTKRTMGTGDILTNIYWTGNEYLSVAKDDTILTSPNLIDWNKEYIRTKYSTTPEPWTDSLFAPGIGTIYTDQDGTKWKYVYWTLSTSENSMVWADSEFVKGIGTIYISQDGTKWKGRINPKRGLSGEWTDKPIWTGKVFVVLDLGEIKTSPDNLNWTRQNIGTDTRFRAIAWTGKSLVVLGPMGNILTSPDGMTWTNIDLGAGQSLNNGKVNSLQEVVWLNNQFIIVGGGGTIMTSPDGITWTTRNSGTRVDLLKTIWINNQFIVQGAYGTILTSPDAITWSLRNTGTPDIWTSLIWTGKLYVLYGNDRDGNKTKGTLLTSPDAITWTWVDPFLGTTEQIQACVWTGKKFATLGDEGTVLTSHDAITWTKPNIGTTEVLQYLIWRDTLLVLYGDSGTVLASPDGIKWTEVTGLAEYKGWPPYTRQYSKTIWTGKLFVRSFRDPDGGAGTQTSPDSLTWTNRNKNYAYLKFWTGTYLVGILDVDREHSSLFISSDGITLDPPFQGWHNGITDIGRNETQFVAIGTNGIILTSPIVLPTRISPPKNINSVIKNNLFLRRSNSTLTATLPTSMLGHKVQAVLRNITGTTILERTVDQSLDEMVLPISGLPNGRYILEVKGAGQMASKSVSLIR